jgi:hypothetical protein
MRHAKTRPIYKRLIPYVVGLSLLGVTGLCVGGVLSEKPETPEVQLDMKGPDTPGPSDEAPKTAEEGQARKDRSLEATDVPQSPESRSPATGVAAPTESPASPEKGSESPEKPSATATATPKPSTPTPTANPTETVKPNPEPKPDKPVYRFFIADDTEQNRTWCDTRPSGSVKVEVGRMYVSYYNDNDPKNAFGSYGYSKEDTTCP